MGKRIVEEKIHLNQNTSGMTEVDGTANVLSDIVTYSVPDKSTIVFNPTDFIALYLEDATAAEIGADSRVVIVITDPQGRRQRVIAEGEYTVFKEFQDATLKFYIGQRVIVGADFVIKIQVNDDAIVDASDCRYLLSCSLIYETLD